MRSRALVLVPLAVLASACLDNDHPGNDREGSLEPPAPAAEMAAVQPTLEGVATGILQPQIMTDADLGNVPQAGARCAFRFTRVGFPVFLYDATSGVIKLNGKLLPLPAVGDGLYSEGKVGVTVRPLDGREGDEQFEAELVLRFEGAVNELGFHGFSSC